MKLTPPKTDVEFFLPLCNLKFELFVPGMDRTFQREDLGRHGFACKIVPEYSEAKQKTFTGCMHRRGTKKFPIKAQSIIPAPSYFKVGSFF